MTLATSGTAAAGPSRALAGGGAARGLPAGAVTTGEMREVRLPSGAVADLTLVRDALGVVVFAHGSGSSRRSGRNRQVAATLNDAGLATLLLDLLTEAEEHVDAVTRHHRFDIALLGERLVGAVDWAGTEPATGALPVGLFGASTGAAAALVAAAQRPDRVRAVVSRGGRPDLAARALAAVRAPTLLVVGGADEVVLDLNRAAAREMSAPVELAVVPGAAHLFEEPGAMEQVARLAVEWFLTRLAAPEGAASRPS